MSETGLPNAPNGDLIYQAGDLKITVDRVLDPVALQLLKDTIYGTTGVRYQHTNQATKVSDLKRPLFFHLWQSTRLVGMYCLDEREIELITHSLRAFYGRYLSVAPQSANKGYGRLLKQQAVAYVEANASSPFLFYSYIEEKNERSLAISQGEAFESVAILKTYFFRRYSPVVDSRFTLATPADLPLIKTLLERYYSTYSFKTFEQIGYQGNYFVLKENGQIVAGIQANPVCWRIKQMPGKLGPILMKLAPLFSASRRFLNPEQQSFAVLEGLYLAQGREDLLPVLLESVLAKLKLYSAMWQLDQIDPIVALLSSKETGLFSGFNKGVKTHVMIKSKGVPDGWLPHNTPLYISCLTTRNQQPYAARRD